MNLKTSAFHNDYLDLNLLDIIKLLLGMRIKSGALYVKIKWFK